jgi:hypothetical protein
LGNTCSFAVASAGALFATVTAGESEGSSSRRSMAHRSSSQLGEPLDSGFFELRVVGRLGGVARVRRFCGRLGASHRRNYAARGLPRPSMRAIASPMGGIHGGRTVAKAGVLTWLGLLLAGCATAGRDEVPIEPSRDGGAGSFARDAEERPLLTTGEVYGHSENTLYRVDTTSHVVTTIGYFQGCTYVADIALDESSNIYASTGTELFYVDTNSARCTRMGQGTFPNSLSFVPAGTVLADAEALVGFQGGKYVRIDPSGGKVTELGEIGDGLESSGDVVSAKGGKTYVTVKGKDCADCLAEIDPANGRLRKNLGPLGHKDVFGLAFWGGELYGVHERR